MKDANNDYISDLKMERPSQKPMPRDAIQNLGMYFTSKEIQQMKKACGAQSKEELMQRLADPRQKFRPSTNMNNTG